MFRYQKTKTFYGQISEDCKELGADELRELGARNIEPDYRGVSFEAKPKDLYRIVYCSRLFSRFLAPIHRFNCFHDDHLYNTANSMEWDRIFQPDMTFAIFANVGNSNIRHSKFAAQRLKDAIADYFMEKYDRRPSVDTKDPDVWINLFIYKNKATINIDLGGGPGHKRGYRVSSVEAPMRETLAAAVVRYSGWDGETPLYDPMCGSGTLLMEAMMSYCRIPALYKRHKFGFENLPDFEAAKWEDVKMRSDERMRPLPPGLIFGSDKDADSIEAVLDNTSEITFGDRVEIKRCDFRDIEEIHNATIICNPPYGMRLDDGTDIGDFMKEIGDFLKQKCTGSEAWIYLGSTALVRRIGLRTSKKIILENGGLDGRLIKLEMYKGTRNP